MTRSRSTARGRWRRPVRAWVAALLCACAARAPVARTATADALRPGATPLEVARAFYSALHAGDAAAAGRLVASRNGARVAESFVAIAGAYRLLEDALRTAYGEDAAGAVGYRARVEAEDEAMARATQVVRVDDAVVSAGDQLLATLRREGGGWRVVLDDALTTDTGVAAIAREAAATRAASERVAPAIQHRLFGSAEDAVEAFRNEVMAQMGREEEELPDEEGAEAPLTL